MTYAFSDSLWKRKKCHLTRDATRLLHETIMRTSFANRVALTACVISLSACGGGGGGSTIVPTPSQNTPPSFTSATTFTFAENQAVDFTITVSDPDSATVTITDDATGDGALFTVDASSGRVTANTSNGAFDFENPQDVNGDNIYEQNITLSDGQASVTETIQVVITGVDEAPEFTNESSVLLNENATGVIATFTAVDPETGVVSSDYVISEVSKIGEVVNSQRLLDAFDVDAVTGELSVVIPFDADIEGTQSPISVQIQATDGNLTGSGSTSIQLVDLEARVVSGIQYRGRDTVNKLGQFATQINDIDQDGLPEVWVDASLDDTGLETAYLIWGKTIQDEMVDGAGDLSIEDLDASQAIRITNDNIQQTERRTLMKAISGGDVDGDGQNDLIIGLTESRDGFSVADQEDGPLAIVIWGDQLEAITGGMLDLQALSANDGLALDGLSRVENIQLSLASGDIDNDGQSDLVFGHPFARNQVRIVYGSALAKGNASFNLATATTAQVLLVQSVTDTNLIQQIGFDVTTIADLDNDSSPELAVSAAGLEPSLENGLYVISSQVIEAAKGGANSIINLLDPANTDLVVEMIGQNAAIAGLSAEGDIDGDGLDDLAIAHIGNFENDLVATVVFGDTLQNAITTGLDPSLVFTTSTEGVNIRATGQIFTQTIGARVSVRIVPSITDGAGDELMLGLGDDSVLGRSQSGAVILLTDGAISGSATAQMSFPVDDLPLAFGRKLAGPTTNARIGGNAFIADVDGDGRPDLSMSSTTAGPASNGFTNGAFLFLPGTELDNAFNASEVLFDMAGALSNESP